ncbi:MAG: arginine repressor [Clostridia bacterium]|nr:arginine repressor [Clostridia bacterium]
MKKKRQAAIRALLKDRPIQTQEDLVEALKEQGFQVTQATVSRDMKEMHLIKTPMEEGGYSYAEPETGWSGLSDRLIRLLRDCMLSVEAAGQMIVVKTMSGAANTAAEALDSMDLPEIAGSIAGDNTIFLVARDHAGALAAAERIQSLMKRGSQT